MILSYSSVEQNWKLQRWLCIYLHISSSKSNMLLFVHSDISKINTTNSDSWRLCFPSPIKVWIILQKCNSWKNKMIKTSFQQAVQLKCLCKVIAYWKYLWWIWCFKWCFVILSTVTQKYISSLWNIIVILKNIIPLVEIMMYLFSF